MRTLPKVCYTAINKVEGYTMGKFVDLSGEKFGRLSVLNRVETLNPKVVYRCRCDCGTIKNIIGTNMKSGKVASCGCLKKEMVAQKNRDNATHGMTGTPLYIVWDGIKKRASELRKPSKDSKHYIDRGITICKEWEESFIEFYCWSMNSGYAKGLQVDRIDNNKGYSPDNCRFVTSFTNNMNKRNNLDASKIEKAEILYNDGVSIADIARGLDMKYSGLYQRLTKRRGC